MKNIIDAQTIAVDFNKLYENAWNTGLEGVMDLYAEDGILVGYSIVNGKVAIADLLGQIFNQGWTSIEIKTIQAKLVGDIVIVANEYTAIGSGDQTGCSLKAKSSHVLFKKADKWLTGMHTAM